MLIDKTVYLFFGFHI